MWNKNYFKNFIPTHFFLTIFISIFFTLQSCSEFSEQPTSPSNNSNQTQLKKLNTSIEQIARGLAVFLQQEKNQRLLETEIKLSKNVEQVLEASQFLNNPRNILLSDNQTEVSSVGEAIAEYFPENERSTFIRSIKRLEFGLIDIYFPIIEHRENWKSGDELYVAFVTPRKKNDRSDIPAYDLNGNQIHLNYEKAPDVPTLVVYPSEKRGNYSANQQNAFIQNLRSPDMILAGGEGPPPTTYYKFKVFEFKITEDFDSGWWGGLMEIYFKVATKLPGQSWSNWFIPFNVINDVEAGQWKTANEQLYSSIYNNAIIEFQVWEFDGGLNFGDDLVADQTWRWVWTRFNTLWGENIVEFPWGVTTATDWSLEAVDDGTDEDNIRILTYN